MGHTHSVFAASTMGPTRFVYVLNTPVKDGIAHTERYGTQSKICITDYLLHKNAAIDLIKGLHKCYLEGSRVKRGQQNGTPPKL